MKDQGVFGEVLEAADRVSLEGKEALIEVLQRRLLDERRDELAQEIAAARQELEAGQCLEASPEDLLKEILG